MRRSLQTRTEQARGAGLRFLAEGCRWIARKLRDAAAPFLGCAPAGAPRHTKRQLGDRHTRSVVRSSVREHPLRGGAKPSVSGGRDRGGSPVGCRARRSARALAGSDAGAARQGRPTSATRPRTAGTGVQMRSRSPSRSLIPSLHPLSLGHRSSTRSSVTSTCRPFRVAKVSGLPRSKVPHAGVRSPRVRWLTGGGRDNGPVRQGPDRIDLPGVSLRLPSEPLTQDGVADLRGHEQPDVKRWEVDPLCVDAATGTESGASSLARAIRPQPLPSCGLQLRCHGCRLRTDTVGQPLPEAHREVVRVADARLRWLFLLRAHRASVDSGRVGIEAADRPFRVANGVAVLGRMTVLRSRRRRERRRRC